MSKCESDPSSPTNRVPLSMLIRRRVNAQVVLLAMKSRTGSTTTNLLSLASPPALAVSSFSPSWVVAFVPVGVDATRRCMPQTRRPIEDLHPNIMGLQVRAALAHAVAGDGAGPTVPQAVVARP